MPNYHDGQYETDHILDLFEALEDLGYDFPETTASMSFAHIPGVKLG